MFDLDRAQLERNLRDHPLVAPRLKHERDAQAAEAAVRECIYGEPVPIQSWLRSSTYQQVKLAFKQITELPVGVGDRDAQSRFIESNREFLLEHPHLHRLLQKVVLRQLPSPPQDEVDRLRALQDGDPSVVAFENKVMADTIVFGLGRVIVDDFGEIITLSGNARGIGAYKILRGMYERLVTASYIAKNPAEARPFADDDAIKKWKLWTNSLEVWPDLKNTTPPETVLEMESEYKRVKAQRSESICSKCGQPKTQEAWTRVDLATMAKQVDANLAVLYGPCYLEPTFHSHATGFGLSTRFRRNQDGANSYQETTPKEARKALLLAHNLILRTLVLQNDYFNLGLASEIQPRFDAFPRIWGRADSDDAPQTSS